MIVERMMKAAEDQENELYIMLADYVGYHEANCCLCEKDRSA